MPPVITQLPYYNYQVCSMIRWLTCVPMVPFSRYLDPLGPVSRHHQYQCAHLFTIPSCPNSLPRLVYSAATNLYYVLYPPPRGMTACVFNPRCCTLLLWRRSLCPLSLFFPHIVAPCYKNYHKGGASSIHPSKRPL